jgi:hypothetical protein
MEKKMEDCDEAMKHLGNVLVILAELVPDERCRALDNALAFYNERNPDCQVEGVEGYDTYLVHQGPLQKALGIVAPTAKGASDAQP